MLERLIADLKISLSFLSRLRLFDAGAIEGAGIAQASWAFPVIGAAIGAIGALVYYLAWSVGLQPFLAATLALGATLLATGCLHEDGLADMADSFGGATSERKLEIMRDSRIGTYGVAALALSLMLRAGAVASLAEPGLVALALIAAHAAARATMPIVMMLVPSARTDGLSAGAGRPSAESAVVAGLLGFAALVLCLGPAGGLIAVLLLAAAIACMARLCLNEFGGQTGDTLGALEQASEILVLLTAASWL